MFASDVDYAHATFIQEGHRVEMDDEGKAVAVGGDDAAIEDAVASCPVGAISEE